MRLLVTGSQGQLARSLAERGAATGAELAFLARPVLDLAQPDMIAAAVDHAIARESPTLVVSAAAYTAVDRAEEDQATAMAVNGEAPGVIAAACARAGVPIVHVSTDYVFDGSLDRPYRPDDPVAPLGVYGRSKERGERAVREAMPDHAILRTAWVTSPFGNNFVRTMLRLAGDRDELRVVGDQHGSPTSALDLADAILRIAERVEAGAAPLGRTYHVAGRGETTWAGLAEHAMAVSADRGGPSARVTPITTAEYPTPAKRPANSRLDLSAFEAAFDCTLPHWRDAQAEVVWRILRDG